VLGSLDGVDGLCRSLCQEAQLVVISVDYRLAPEHQFPVGVEDCWAATCWVAENAESLGLDPLKLVVGGDSAGGNLAAVVALRALDQAFPKLAGQVLIYPVTDLTQCQPSYESFAEGYLLTRDSMTWFIQQYLPQAMNPKTPEASVLFAESLVGLSPTLLLVAGFDPLRDEGLAYAQRLREAGVPVIEKNWEGMVHGFINQRDLLPQAQEASQWIAQELRRLLGKSSVIRGSKNIPAKSSTTKASGGYEIREMELEDLYRVYALGELLYTAEDWPNLYRTWDETDLINNYTSDGEFCWVAETDTGEIVGFALGAMLEKRRNAWVYGWVDWLGVHSAWQGKGVGKRLLDKLTDLFIEEGARMILIDTEADNEKALRFFKKEGFGNPNEHVYLSRNLTHDPEYLKRKQRTPFPGKSRAPNNSLPKPQRP
jgi:acetyl esterase